MKIGPQTYTTPSTFLSYSASSQIDRLTIGISGACSCHSITITARHLVLCGSQSYFGQLHYICPGMYRLDIIDR